MTTAKVINLYRQDPVATCPQCRGQQWFIHVNGFYDSYDKVTAHECSDCGFTVHIKVEVVKNDN